MKDALTTTRPFSAVESGPNISDSGFESVAPFEYPRQRMNMPRWRRRCAGGARPVSMALRCAADMFLHPYDVLSEGSVTEDSCSFELKKYKDRKANVYG